MTNLIELPKQLLIPGSAAFLLLGLVVGVVLLNLAGRPRLWGRWWLSGLALVYLLLSLPLTASALEAALQRDHPAILSAQGLQDVEAIVVLGGGSATFRAAGREINELSDASALRVLEAARLHPLFPEAQLIVSGGADVRSGSLSPETDPMVQELLAGGVAAKNMATDPISGSTREQALNLAAMLRSQGVSRFILVTSPIHMRRALGSFREQGLQPIPSPSAQHGEGHPVLGRGVLPHPEALSASHLALREFIALSYYWARGWLASQ